MPERLCQARLAGPATDFGLLAAMLKRPQSHITQIGLEALER